MRSRRSPPETRFAKMSLPIIWLTESRWKVRIGGRRQPQCSEHVKTPGNLYENQSCSGQIGIGFHRRIVSFFRKVCSRRSKTVSPARDVPSKQLPIEGMADPTSSAYVASVFDLTEEKFERGKCQECGMDLLKWDEVWLRDTRDVDKKFAFFEREWIRHFFFHVPTTSRIRKYAHKHGLEGLGRILQNQLRNKKMLTYIPALDSTQTKMLDGTIVHWARHAVGCCCR